MTTEQVTDILRQQLPYLSTEYGVKRLGIFGSYAKGTQKEQSDIDLIAEFERPLGLKFIELTDYLEQLFRVPVDVLTLAGVAAIRDRKISENIQKSIVYV